MHSLYFFFFFFLLPPSGTKLDFEGEPNAFTLGVRGADGGVPSLAGNVALSVIVQNVNEAPDLSAYTYSIPEHPPADQQQLVPPLTSLTSDRDVNQKFNYGVTSTERGTSNTWKIDGPSDDFANQPSGWNTQTRLTVDAASNLDFEDNAKNSYELTVTVKDYGPVGVACGTDKSMWNSQSGCSGSTAAACAQSGCCWNAAASRCYQAIGPKQQTGTAKIQVNVLDVNEVPSMSAATYAMSVQENDNVAGSTADIDDPFVMATDPDDLNGQVGPDTLPEPSSYGHTTFKWTATKCRPIKGGKEQCDTAHVAANMPAVGDASRCEVNAAITCTSDASACTKTDSMCIGGTQKGNPCDATDTDPCPGGGVCSPGPWGACQSPKDVCEANGNCWADPVAASGSNCYAPIACPFAVAGVPNDGVSGQPSCIDADCCPHGMQLGGSASSMPARSKAKRCTP